MYFYPSRYCMASVSLSSSWGNRYLYRMVPPEMQATGHMVFMGITFGVTSIIGSSIGGVIFDVYSGTVLYLSMAGCALIGTIGFIFFYMKEKAKARTAIAVKG